MAKSEPPPAPTIRLFAEPGWEEAAARMLVEDAFLTIGADLLSDPVLDARMRAHGVGERVQRLMGWILKRRQEHGATRVEHELVEVPARDARPD